MANLHLTLRKKMNRVYKRLITIIGLWLTFSGYAFSEPVKIDLNQNDTYLIRGYDKDLINEKIENGILTEYLDKIIHSEKDQSKKSLIKEPPAENGRKMMRPNLYQFKGIPVASFFNLKHFQVEHFTYVVRFSVSEDEYKKLVNPAFYITSIGTNHEFFINGSSVFRKMDYTPGKKTLNTIFYCRHVHFGFDKSLLKKEKDNYLVIHVIGDPLSAFTGLAMSDELFISNYKTIEKHVDQTLDLVFIFAYLIVGLYHILLFIRRPKEKYNLQFGLYGIGLFIYLMTRSIIPQIHFPHLSKDLYLVEVIDLYFIVTPFIFFLDLYLKGKISLFSKIYLIWAGFLSLSVFLAINISGTLRIGNYILRIWHISMLPVLIYIMYITIRQFISENAGYKEQYKEKPFFIRNLKSFFMTLGNTGAGNLITGVLVLTVAVVYDILEAAVFQTGITLTRYGFFVFVMGIAVSLANRFLNVYKQVEDLNLNLEKKVEERTNELAESLDHIKTLKVQQDGDYFLTSLLIDPLNSNYAHNRGIKIDFYVEEKKKFRFRRWEKEIGGDICFAHSIELREKAYTLFLNADAMGKSMQGAGGILVLGAVLKSVTERTLLSSVEKNLYPEKWIRNVFVELQKVFESFDGSMLISCVFGLVDEENGFTYMINAEHPWSVLYRDRRAEFIETDLSFHKLGTQGVRKKIWIRTFQMQYDDTIIIGSDGRDDILTGRDNDNQRIINEDENKFLEHVEAGQGDLDKITKSIKDTGELTDDLSLLRIHNSIENEKADDNEMRILFQAREAYKERRFQKAIDNITNELSLPKDEETWKILIRSLLKTKNYKESLVYTCRFIEAFPGNSDFIYYASFSAFQLKQYRKAADISERLRLREPENVKNLLLLSETYRALKNYPRSAKMSKEALSLEPDNEKAKIILEKLNTIEDAE